MDLNSYKVWTAVITPMNDDGSVDYESLGKLLKAQESAGNGITILGSTGEALNLRLEVKKQILDFAIEQNLTVPLMVGLGGAIIEDQLSLIEYLNGIEVHAYLIATPYYSKPGDEGQYNWFKTLFDASIRPICLYNIPGRAATSLSKSAFKRLAKHENFWALKEASGSVDEFVSYKDTAPNCHMLSGDDPMFGEFTHLGAKGVVSVAGNVWPNQVQKIAQEFAADDFANEELFVAASKALFSASNPVPAKAILADKSVISSAKVLPPLSAADMGSLDKLRAYDQKLQSI